MPVEIKITDDDISYAEQLLLPEGLTFDEERRDFIQNFETIDLQAVPGSGKTTALLAKLIILERYLPFSDGSGILVLSHTNAAVNEIKNKIQKHCPKLFSYPNFVGTIQGFVDEFLAIPYYVQCYGKKPFRIDNEIYLERLESKLNKCLSDQTYETFKKISHIKMANYKLLENYRFEINENQKLILISEINGNKLNVAKPKGNTKPENYCDYSQEEKSQVIKYLIQLKMELLKEGKLHFDDAYFLASRYLQKFPQIKTILQKRFAFVFVDEMQDMDKHQYQLLENLFYDEGKSLSIYQRIGDKNQSIYNGDAKLQDLWEERNVKHLKGSLRLSQPIANIVQKFALHSIEITGLGKNNDGSEIDILPYIILYNDDSKSYVIEQFAKIIKEFKDDEKLPKNQDNRYYAIAWNTVWDNQENLDNQEKIRLVDYYSDYSKEENKSSIDYSTLESYLNFYDKNKQTLYSIRRNILNAFLRVLRFEKIRDKDNEDREFTKRSLLKYLRQSVSQAAYNEFKLNIFRWSLAVIKGQSYNTLKEIKNYIPEFLCKFPRAISATENRIELSTDFINNPCSTNIVTKETTALSKRNSFKYEGIEIQIGTVHSVKGQTHTATLYLESYYYADGTGENAKSYESQRLAEQFKLNELSGNEGERIKQSAKMAYVGFSRPTHLLCIGIHQKRFNEFIKEVPDGLWNVVKVDC